MTLSNELKNAIAAVSVFQTSTSKTANEFEFGSLQKQSNVNQWSMYAKFRRATQCLTYTIKISEISSQFTKG
jgi:hypothetical protein